MSFYTPLRYPGGKRRLLAFIKQILETNELRNIQYVEPCAGGASLALALLYEEYASCIHINDLSRPVFAFWHSVLHDNESLCRRIERTEITMGEWFRQRSVYENSEEVDLKELGFATFFLNRTNRSGIISGGVIGGREQKGEWKLDCRFTKGELLRRIKRVGRYRNRIHLYQQDALNFTDNVVSNLNGNVLAFYDPPYIEKGKTLYLDKYELNDHRRLAEAVRSLIQPWIVTYDYDAATQHELYPDHRCLSFWLSYSTQRRHHGREAMFISDKLALPATWMAGTTETSMSASHSEHPVYGKLERLKSGDASSTCPVSTPTWSSTGQTIPT